MNIRKLNISDNIPYDLLLEADPSLKMIGKYLNIDFTYVAEDREKIIAVCALYPIDDTTIEIKNISVSPSYQRRGICKSLLAYAETVSKDKGYKRMIIGTADISASPLGLYKKQGFVVFGKKRNFFVENYDEPIFDNGEQCIDMVMLEKAI